jgi:hypothetical protein
MAKPHGEALTFEDDNITLSGKHENSFVLGKRCT